MVLSIKDFELLKLICWCKNIPYRAGTNFSSLYNSKEISMLEQAGFLLISKDGENIRPRPSAYRFLSEAGINYKFDTKAQTKDKVLSRRNIGAQILFTFYMAGISVFQNELTQSIDKPVYVASFAARRTEARNPFGSTRFYGIFCTSQEAFLVLYTDNVGVHYNNEIALFNNLIGKTGIRNTAIILMGKSTFGIGKEVLGAKQSINSKGKNKPSTFARIFEITPLPVHFIPIGEAGAQLLRFMLIPNFRENAMKALLKNDYKPPYDGLTDTDTIHYEKPHYPVVFAVDMDIKRIDRAVISAQQAGFEKIAIYALMEQAAFLKYRYGNPGVADIMAIQVEKIKHLFDYDVDLYMPPSAPYFTKEGRYFNATDFPAYRKAGEQN